MGMDGSPEFSTVGGGIVVKQATSSYTMAVPNTNVGNRGLIVYPFVDTAGGGTVITDVIYRDRFANDFPILSTAATSAAGPVTPLVIAPGLLTVANQTLGYVLGGRYYIRGRATGTITYSISYDEVP